MLDVRTIDKSKTKIRSFTDLLTWQAAYKLSLEVYKFTAEFPREENFGLTSQMRRSSVSVVSNVAEGFGRSGKKDQENFYQMASGSLYELRSQIMIAEGLSYFSADDSKQLVELTDRAHKLLHGLLRSHRLKERRTSNIKHPTSKGVSNG